MSELGASLEQWRAWFQEAAEACLRAVPDDGVAWFFQTDLKREGRWISKAGLLLSVADRLEVPLLLHKVVCRKPPGRPLHGRPSYSHLLAFSRACRHDPARPLPDVLPDLGEQDWSHGMGTAAATLAVDFILRNAPETTTVLAPFCGTGTALAAANQAGLDAIGIERNRKRSERARHIG